MIYVKSWPAFQIDHQIMLVLLIKNTPCFLHMLDVSLRGLTVGMLPYLRRGRGVVINVSSWGSQMNIPIFPMSYYCTWAFCQRVEFRAVDSGNWTPCEVGQQNTFRWLVDVDENDLRKVCFSCVWRYKIA